MNKLLSMILVLMTGLWLNGCGLTSGTIFVDQEVDGRIESQAGAGSALDDQVGHVIVDFTDNSSWQDYTIEGIEDGCIVLDAWNLLATPISGEVWITLDTTSAATSAITTIAGVQAAGGFRVFSGIALDGGPDPVTGDPTKHFTCAETFALLENVDQLVGAMQQGYFVAWGFGNEGTYHFVFDGIVFGAHVTGSL